MRSPPGTFAGLGEVRGGESKDGGGYARWLSPASGESGATEGILAWGLVQKNKCDTRILLEHAGWRVYAQMWLAVARGGPGSPAWGARATRVAYTPS